ncbi:MAG: hypothetical protein KAR33_09380 [Candidatus Thorarchaeota archaeon]|nr:hypothetical protein [Candidatus Thorarchaeota archaeon]
MVVDPYGITIVVITIILSTHAARTTLRIYKELGTEFFKYATFACISLVLMITGYMFPAVFNSEEYSALVLGGQVILASFGILALAFLTAATENVKETPNEWVMNGGFLLSGALIVSRFRPDQYVIQWTGTRWVQSYGTVVVILSVMMFAYLIAVLGPVVFRVSKRIRKSEVYKTQSRVLFLGFAVILVVYAVIMLVLNSIGAVFSSSSTSYFMILILLAGLSGFISRLLQLYPTIFFASRSDILEIQFVAKATQNTVYRFLFLPENPNRDSLSISIAHDSIRHVFHDALDETGEVKSIKVEENEVLACEGENLYGLLVTRRGSDLLRRLLVKSLNLFERTVNTTQYYEDDEFNAEMRNYFQFAIPNVSEYEIEAGEEA